LQVITYSQGRGSSAAWIALIALVLVSAGRARLTRDLLYGHSKSGYRQLAFFRLTWRLFQRPLLAVGWTVAAMAIGLALFRNLWLLGGDRIQQIWAVIGLLINYRSVCPISTIVPADVLYVAGGFACLCSRGPS
jgi:hypothetical protein